MNSERHQKLMSILADALECDADQRGNLVADSCAEDEALRREVERLLRYSQPAMEFMEESVFAAAARSYGETDSLIGQNIGAYRVIDQIGRGGMGAVYLAMRNDDQYQRKVAIKVVKRGMDTDTILRRFRNERQILANLDHQNIARLFDGGTTDDGRPYLVMEYVAGKPVHRYADDNNLSVDERLQLFLSVCDAVEYAHTHGVIHRDLKPGNILMTEEGMPKLLDFGIAKLLKTNFAGMTSESTLTALRGMTPEYASPEQMRGETLTTASDVYSLGVLLYELLTGRRPFELAHRSPYEIAQLVCDVVPVKPSAAVLQSLRETSTADADLRGESLSRRLSGDVETIIMMALRKEPERRYASVGLLAEDIRKHLAGMPIIARQDAPAYRVAKFVKRNRGYVLSMALVAIICVMLGISLTLLTKRAQPATAGVAPARDRKHSKDDEAYQLYMRGNYFWNLRNSDGFAKAIDCYQKAIERDPNYALAYDGLAKTYGLLGAYFIPSDAPFPKAKAAALKALELDPNLAEAHTSLALIHWLHDWDWPAAEREFRRAIELDPRYVTAHQWYGLYLGEMSRADESISEIKRALELEPASVAVTASLGRAYFWARRTDEALQQYQKADEMGPTIGAFWTEQRYVYEQKKLYAEWFSMLDTRVDVNDYNRRAFLKKDWKEFVRISCEHSGHHDAAENCARAGNKERAFENLELAYQIHDHRMSQLRVNPIWDGLRDDPRFAELLRRMKL